ncbi:MAG: peptidoglycan DD-metalloendopeptidase family protein [Myxococcota bacterium]
MSLALAMLFLAAEGSFLSEALELDQRLRGTESALNEARAERELLRVESSRLQGELAAAQLRYGEVYKGYEKRVRALARMSPGSRLLMLGNSDSLRAYLRDSRLLRRITQADQTIASERARVAKRISTLESAARKRERDAQALEDSLKTQRDRLAALRAEKIAMLDQLARDPTVAKRVRAEAARARRELGALVEKLEPRGPLKERFSDNRGRLPWPSTAPIRARFGEELEREFGTTVRHNGIDFGAPAGSTVQTIAPGTAVYADWLRGYGLLAIIDHGGGYHSLYAHLADTTLRPGDRVELGDQVGVVGDSGSLRGTLLYFELREQGVAIDPSPWLRPE